MVATLALNLAKLMSVRVECVSRICVVNIGVLIVSDDVFADVSLVVAWQCFYHFTRLSSSIFVYLIKFSTIKDAVQSLPLKLKLLQLDPDP